MENQIIEGYRLSPQQQRVWQLMQRDGASRYCARCALMLDGELDVHTLQVAVQDVVARHEILRTRLEILPGMRLPLQVIEEDGNVAIDIEDLNTVATDAQAARVDELFAKPNSDRLEARLLLLAPNKHLLFFSLPAFFADGPSLRNLMKDLAQSYKARLKAGEPDEEPMQYVDYAGWQNDLLESPEAEAGKLYWRKRDLSETAALKLPFERSASSTTEWITRSEEQTIEFATIEALATRYNVPVSTFLLAALYALLWRLTGRSDLLIGVAHDGRRYEELSSVIGPIAKYLPLACAVGDMGFAQFVERVQEVIQEARQWQEVFTYESDESALMPFTFEYLERAEPYRIGDLQFSMYREEVCLDRFKIKLSCERETEILKLQFHFDEKYYDTTAISYLSSQFCTLLHSLVAQPDITIGRLNLLSNDERQRLLVDWNNTSAAYSLDRCLPELFEAQVQRTPDSIAVVYQDEKLTYNELNERANQLAYQLRYLGVGMETLVGVMMERSLEMMVALLGVLKAGSAYLPLDPEYPHERLRFIIEDAKPAVIVTQKSLQSIAAELGDVLIIDEEFSRKGAKAPRRLQSDAERSSFAPLRLCASNLAYVIYTSGSTGQPKGVMIPHRGICNHMLWMINAFDFKPTDRFLQKTPFTFDAAGWEFFMPLLCGAQVVMAEPGGHQDTAYLVNAIAEHEITILQLVPSMLQIVLKERGIENCRTLRHVYCGGETLPGSLHTRFHNRLSCELHNLYGPTEYSIDAACWPSQPETFERTVPIGRALSNTHLYVLDQNYEPVPLGATGELFIGGSGLARAYLNRPELTAERFVPHCFSTEPGTRLYRTGDLVRYMPDGNLEFLGRVDHQVKVRGFRIELGEIEAVLCRHSQVREAIVVAREDGANGEKRLVAYVVGELEAATSELRSYLKQHLPEYMIPAAFVVLDKLPLLSNGKVDRKRLPEPETSRPSLTDAYEPPTTEAERVLARIWSEVLRVEQVGIHDNFFELGGDSILSVQIITRAHRAGLQLTAKQVFNRQTIAELAAVAGSATQSQTTQGEVTGAVELTPAQRGFFEQQLAEPKHWNMAKMIALAEGIEVSALRGAITAVLHHHDALRNHFQKLDGGRWRQWCAAADEGELPFAEVDLSEVATTELRNSIETAAAKWQETLDLEKGPMLRAVYFTLGHERGARLLLVVHHLVMDVVSWRILLEDLQTAYQQLASAADMQLQARSTSYQQWATKLQAYASSSDLQEEVSYWTDERRSRVQRLPVDQEGRNLESTARYVSNKLSTELTEALLREVPRVYNTQIGDVLLAALAGAHQRWSGERLLVVDAEGHGREALFDDVDLTRTVGWFTSIYPVLLELPAGSDYGERLKSIKEQVRRVKHGGVGYGVLRYLSSDEAVRRQLAAQTQAEISFNYLGRYEQAMSEMKEAGLFRAAPERPGTLRAGVAERLYKLQLLCSVVGGELQVSWEYSSEIHHVETVAQLAAEYLEELERLIRHCQSSSAGGFTPSDFPQAELTQSELDDLIALFPQTDDGSKKKQIEAIYPLSPLQQGILFHSLYDNSTSMYVSHLSCALSGELDIAAFKQAWQRVVDRHAVLRTMFVWEGQSKPLQVVRQHVDSPWIEHDWLHYSAAEQKERLEIYLETDRERGFDFLHAPLMRLTLIRMNEDSYHFIWSHHHMLMDGWSAMTITREVFALYEAFARGEELQLQHTLTYRDYIAWLHQQHLEEAKSFWRQTLAGFTSPTPVGGLTSSPARRKYQVQRRRLSVDLTRDLETLGHEHQLTMNTLLQGAWGLLLSRHSGRDDVLFGGTVSGRPAALLGAEDVVGLFINTLPVRVQVKKGVALLPWLKSLQEQQLEVRQYEYTPLVELHGWSDVPRHLPLFESIFVFENYPVEVSFGERSRLLRISEVKFDIEVNYPLAFVIKPGAALTLEMIYDRVRFDKAYIDTMLLHVETLLGSMVANPGALLDELEFLETAVAVPDLSKSFSF
ncbi:MAG TPA: amino acid adenylation domain-containing protein [Pyrinomonadaceae bacterium]|jgi:amino acid adenylation domain-containing protein/non-ribosomal peptide synthase protein (TIGR01720 family)